MFNRWWLPWLHVWVLELYASRKTDFFFFILLFKYCFGLMENVHGDRKLTTAFFDQFHQPAVFHINFIKDPWGKMCCSVGKQITSKETQVVNLWPCTSAISDMNLWGLVPNLLDPHKSMRLSTFKKIIPTKRGCKFKAKQSFLDITTCI